MGGKERRGKKKSGVRLSMWGVRPLIKALSVNSLLQPGQREEEEEEKRERKGKKAGRLVVQRYPA